MTSVLIRGGSFAQGHRGTRGERHVTTEDQIGVRELQTKKTPSNPSQQKRREAGDRSLLECQKEPTVISGLPDSVGFMKEKYSVWCFTQFVMLCYDSPVELTLWVVLKCLPHCYRCGLYHETLGMSAGGKVLFITLLLRAKTTLSLSLSLLLHFSYSSGVTLLVKASQ